MRHVVERRQGNTNDSETLVRDLKRQVNEKDLALSDLHDQIKTVEKERSEAILAKDSLVAFHQTEISVSLQIWNCLTSPIFANKWD